MAETALDTTHARMQADVNDPTARLRFYERLAGSELFLLLTAEAEGDQISPETFELSDDSYVLAFDREDRLTRFTGAASPYAALSGRAICQMLSAGSLGLGLNLDVAPSSILIPPEAVTWLASLNAAPAQIAARVEKFVTPKGLTEDFLTLLDTRLAAAAGMAASAYLVGVTYENGSRGHLLGFIDALPQAHTALTQTVSQALIFSGLEAAALDVGFFAATDSVSAKLARCGLRFNLPKPNHAPKSAPGSNPDKPPILT